MEDNFVYVIEFLDSKGFKRFMANYDANSTEECKKFFKKIEPKASIKNIKLMSEYDYKHMI